LLSKYVPLSCEFHEAAGTVLRDRRCALQRSTFPYLEKAMFSFAHTSKLMTTMATSTVTVANVIVQWPFVMAYRGGLVRLDSSVR
jgi:hypothetical protein